MRESRESEALDMADEEETKVSASDGAAGSPTGGEVPPIPEYELKSYDPVEFDMPKMEVSEEQVDQKMKEYAERYGTQYVPTKRKVVGPKEDVKIDIEVRRDGEVVPNVSSDDRLYTLGEGLMPAEFDRAVLGMNVGDTKTFTFKAPDYDDPQGAERDFEATVTVNKIMKKTVPEITDRWVRQYMPQYKSAKDFREQTRKGISEEADRMIDGEKRERAAHALAERFEGHIDDYWYETTRADLHGQYEQQAHAQGLDLQDFIERQGMDENSFSMMLMFQAREMLTQGFALDAWARHYGLEATDDDIKALAEMIVPTGHADELIARVKQDPRQEAAFRLAAKRYVANKDLVAKAKINYVDAPSA